MKFETRLQRLGKFHQQHVNTCDVIAVRRQWPPMRQGSA